jgi:hypothetical protein
MQPKVDGYWPAMLSKVPFPREGPLTLCQSEGASCEGPPHQCHLGQRRLIRSDVHWNSCRHGIIRLEGTSHAPISWDASREAPLLQGDQSWYTCRLAEGPLLHFGR